ncbi:MAG: hypothetical protein ACYTF6_03075 [Planctomycetota bacterium]
MRETTVRMFRDNRDRLRQGNRLVLQLADSPQVPGVRAGIIATCPPETTGRRVRIISCVPQG